MQLETRRIRPSGRTTGSVELTLPRELRDLQGIECEVLIRDGEKPEIGLVPDLASAIATIASLWQALRHSLASVRDIGDVPWDGLELALFPTGYQPGQVPISYLDILRASGEYRPGTTKPRDRTLSLSRVVAALLVRAGLRLGLKPERAVLVGSTVAYLCTGLAGTAVRGTEELLEVADVEPVEVQLREIITERRLPRLIEEGLVRITQKFEEDGQLSYMPPSTFTSE